MTPLHVAALSQHPDCARVLVAHGADENVVCKFSREYKGTPRDFAEQHLDVCKDLMHRDREVIAVLDKSVHKREKKISASQQGGGHFLPSVGSSRKNSRVSVSRRH